MAIRNLADLVSAEDEGRSCTTHFARTVGAATFGASQAWYDITSLNGSPRAKQWFDATPLTAKAISQSIDNGLWHGGNVEPLGMTKVLRKASISVTTGNVLPQVAVLSDYLLYYPTIDESDTGGEQVMDNTQVLTRYTDGAGVSVAAINISSRTGGGTFQIRYTNDDGVANRVSKVMTLQNTPNACTATGSANAGDSGPFITLQDGDCGVRSIQGVTMLSGDTGFFTLVMMRPLAWLNIVELNVPYEKDMLVHSGEAPRVFDDAYLSWMAFTSNGGALSYSIRGFVQTVWG